jgi:hypothetical protein
MIRNKKIFTGGANQDDSLHLIEDTQYLRVMNGRVGVTQYGRNNRVEGVPGTTSIPQSKYPPYGANITIGSCIDIENQRMAWFVYNTMGDHGIYCYDMVANQVYAVIYDSQIEGGLNFNKDYRIDRNCKVINGVLYWSDNYNEPKKINIDKGIKTNQAGYSTNETAYEIPSGGIPYTTFTIIRRPPFYALNVIKEANATFDNNFIEEAAFQMCYYYDFVDNEKSRLSAFSTLMNFNSPNQDAYNFIKCTIPFSEKIESEIERINICAKDVVTNLTFIVKTFDRYNPVDALAIFEHNEGTAQLTFDFYNDITGVPLSASQSSIPFDLVPQKSTTLEAATARLFLGNNLAGYDTPILSSLAIPSTTLITPTGSDGDQVFKTSGSYNISIVFYDRFRRRCGVANPINYTIPYFTQDQTSFIQYLNWTLSNVNAINEIPNWAYFYQIVQTKSLVQSDFVQIATNGIQYATKVPEAEGGGYTYGNIYSSSVYAIALNLSSLTSIGLGYNFKEGDLCRISKPEVICIEYEVYADDGTEDKNAYSYTYTACNGALRSGSRVNQGPSINICAQEGTVISDSPYIFADEIGPCGGKDATSYNVQVIGQDGQFVLVEAFDLGLVSTTDYTKIEIYTPRKTSVEEPYYEASIVYKINNPSSITRQYNTTSGQLLGDVYVLERIDGAEDPYFTENMSPNDRIWQYWNTNSGWANFITSLGQAQNEYEIRYSNVYTTGTANNGLSTFEVLNFKTVPLGMGNIQKLQLASKTTEQGVIMLAIGSFQTASCYLGEVQVVGASQNAFLAQDVAVIGTINVLKGMLGTTQPETVVEYLGVIFWYDLNNGQIAQYSSNGVFPISSFKMERLFKNYAKGYLAANSNNLDNINGFHHIPTYIDPFHKEFGISLPGLIYENYADTLPSYPTVPAYASSIINRFDISDNLSKTVVFHLQDNQWKSDYQFIAEQYEYFENRMFGFKNGALYEFNTNTSTWNTWFGTQYPVRICWVVNQPLSGLKDMAELVVEGNQAPDYTVLYTTLPNTQITDLTETEFVSQEGIYYGRFLRDRLSPNATGTPDQKMLNGDVILSQIPQIMAEWQSYDSIIYVNFVDVGFNLSRGQNFILGNQ